MKTFLSALALAFAVPAVAHTTPATDPHSGHNALPKPLARSPHQPAKHDCKACCEEMKGKDSKMDCEKDASAKPPVSEQTHEGHAH